MPRDKLFRIIFWTALVVALGLALNPKPPHFAVGPGDKVQHILAFLTLTAMAVAAYPRARWIPLALALSGFGALIELLQRIPVLHRSSEFMDWVADTGAVLAVLALAAIFRWLRVR